MARRKKAHIDDYSSSDGDSDGDNYASDEHGHDGKRRKKYQTKDDHIYGVFAEDEDDEAQERDGGVGRTVRGRDRKGKKVDYLRGQAFVPASSKGAQQASAVEDENEIEQSDSSSTFEGKEDDPLEKEMQRLRQEPIDEELALETRPAFGGLGFSGPTAMAKEAKKEASGAGFKPTSFVSSRSGIGSRRPDATSSQTEEQVQGTNRANGQPGLRARPGIASTDSGISTPVASTSKNQVLEDAGPAPLSHLPPSFGSTRPSSFNDNGPSVSKNSFLSSTSGRGKAAVQKGSSIKFGKGFNPAEMLAKMGWSGGGLGKQGEGIVNPIDVQVRPERAGMGFGGRREMTEQNRQEARRRGQVFSSDEEDQAADKGNGQGKGKAKTRDGRSAGPRAWTKAEKKPRKPKIEHRTYEEIIEEAGTLPSTDAGIGQIIDATGREMREVSSLASALAQHAVPTSDSTRLPELRHNLRLICDCNRQALDELAKEGAAIRDRQKWVQRELEEAERRIIKESKGADSLKRVLELVRDIEGLGRKAQLDQSLGLDVFDTIVQRLQRDFADDVVKFSLDEALVGAIAPVVRRIATDWEPLKEPVKMTRHLKRWATALRLEEPQRNQKGKGAMTPYETLLWQIVMPKIRSAINNDWDPHHPSAAVVLVTAWSAVLPRFIKDNTMDQLLLPKIKKSLSEWDPRGSTSDLQHIVFPWLPIFPERAEELLTDAKRRFRSGLKAWKPSRDIPSGTRKWREVFKESDWDSMMLDVIVPKLGAALRFDLTINPSKQDMSPLERALQWTDLLRPGVLSRILEKEFFPKWLEILHMWLTQPSANLDEVAQWYTFWKAWFPKAVAALPGISQGFRRGLDLINEAIELGDERHSKLRKPDITPMSRTEFAAVHKVQRQAEVPVANRLPEEVSFKSLVEEAAAEADLLVQPLNRTESTSGAALYRISRALDGKHGINFYISDDVLWLEERDATTGHVQYLPVGMQELFAKVK
ncbi:TFP11-domain-containing protein [Tilletiaria anomala UBC 951]|uniref:TFP11-domain-containing protein n=1 Tax=Tilletiaria anomala (strain ATCC 24038 / CBS 436.72 / UBC 951) TaxID=1037660 RepID=A0A066VBT0_TILAU|nr:TFP11-domain-containing protein [Tilletiaria anomala UBC 951]KDN37748.1 TFP11-domain-containing protein [Tilletiaria anomala UBC 951]